MTVVLQAKKIRLRRMTEQPTVTILNEVLFILQVYCFLSKKCVIEDNEG